MDTGSCYRRGFVRLQRFEAEEKGEARKVRDVSCFDNQKHSRRFYPFISVAYRHDTADVRS
jgi:hypothetical protein